MSFKSAIALFSAFLMAFTVFSGISAALAYEGRDAAQVTHYGDANMDGTVNTADATVILKHAAGIKNITDPVQFDFADANRDGLVNTADATYVLKVAAGMLEARPVPGVEPTEEPTSEPTEEPTGEPTEEPTGEPTEEPTGEPTEEPTPTPVPTPDPTPTPTPTPEGGKVVITFLPGDDEDNGGGVKKDGYMPDEQVITGEYGILYKDKIPHSVSCVKGETNAYAFTYWTDDDGNIYYPGDRIYTNDETTDLVLTANWDDGYTVLMGPDDIERYVFDNLNAKVVVGCDFALYYVSSAYLYPIGFDQNSPWNQILYLGAFRGTFEGAGFTIRNFTIEYGKSPIDSAFFYENKGTISNLNFKVNQMYSTGDKLAGIACTNYGTIRNVNVTWDNRNNAHYIQGLLDILCLNVPYEFDEDWTYEEHIKTCPKVAGIASENYGTIENCDVTELQMAVIHGLCAGVTAFNQDGALIDNCRSIGVFTDLLYVAADYTIHGDELGAICSINKGMVRDCTDTGYEKMHQKINYSDFMSIPVIPEPEKRRIAG